MTPKPRFLTDEWWESLPPEERSEVIAWMHGYETFDAMKEAWNNPIIFAVQRVSPKGIAG